VRRFGADVQRVALRLRQLGAAVVLDGLRALPGNRLEKPRGEREGQFSTTGVDFEGRRTTGVNYQAADKPYLLNARNPSSLD